MMQERFIKLIQDTGLMANANSKTSDLQGSGRSGKLIAPMKGDETIEQAEKVGFGTRFLSYSVDAVILFFLGYGIQALFGYDQISLLLNASTLEAMRAIEQPPYWVSVLSMAMPIVYFVSFWLLNDGATPGKKLMAIKIVKTDGSSLTLLSALLRYLGFFISSFLLGIGFLLILFDSKKQGLHDKIASTYVVKTKATPNTVLAVLITLIFLVAYLGFFGYVFYRTMALTVDELGMADGNFSFNMSYPPAQTAGNGSVFGEDADPGDAEKPMGSGRFVLHRSALQRT
jgi:uncharacterized RDD family membrane protein YckC